MSLQRFSPKTYEARLAPRCWTSTPLARRKPKIHFDDPAYQLFVADLEQPHRGKVTGMYPVPLGIISGNFVFAKATTPEPTNSTLFFHGNPEPSGKPGDTMRLLCVSDGPEETTGSLNDREKRPMKECLWIGFKTIRHTFKGLRRSATKFSRKVKKILCPDE